MQLTPTRPPGRSDRRASVFGDQIRALRAQGYTFETIRETLAAAGLDVSRSTVQREARRLPPDFRPPASTQPRPAQPQPPGRSGASLGAGPVDRRSSQQIAEDFMSQQITNPLLRHQETR